MADDGASMPAKNVLLRLTFAPPPGTRDADLLINRLRQMAGRHGLRLVKVELLEDGGERATSTAIPQAACPAAERREGRPMTRRELPVVFMPRLRCPACRSRFVRIVRSIHDQGDGSTLRAYICRDCSAPFRVVIEDAHERRGRAAG